MRDLAKQLGVSGSTVSRAFSRPDLLPDATVQRILAAAREHGYAPDRVAQALSLGRYGNAALIVPDIANPFFPPLIRAAQAAANALDVSCYLGDSDEDPAREEQLVRQMSRQSDGILLVSSRLPEAKIRAFSQELNLVLVNRDVTGTRRVLIDTAPAVCDAMEYLAYLGHRQFAYISGPSTSWSNVQREHAAKMYAAEHGLSLHVLKPPAATYQAAPAVVPDILARGITSVLAFDDVIASGVVNELADRGIAVPEDVSIVGCDDLLITGTRPTLTTIAARVSEAGEVGMRLLLESSSDSDERHALSCQLIVRDSTGPITA